MGRGGSRRSWLGVKEGGAGAAERGIQGVGMRARGQDEELGWVGGEGRVDWRGWGGGKAEITLSGGDGWER